MENLEKIIRERRSVRTFEDIAPDNKLLSDLLDFCSQIKNPYNIPVEFKLLDGKLNNLKSQVVVGSDTYIGAKIANTKYLNAAFGYSFEMMILYAQSLGLGTVWIGGTMDRPAFEQAMELSENEVMPCVTPVGYTAKKMSMRESLMRKGIKADSRMDFTELFFSGSFETPLKASDAGNLSFPLEMVRLAPSAVNKQPWRLVVSGDMVHFYLCRAKGFGYGTLDMQMIDIGIALCHFDLAAKECGINTEFIIDNPQLTNDSDVEYIASYKIK